MVQYITLHTYDIYSYGTGTSKCDLISLDFKSMHEQATPHPHPTLRASVRVIMFMCNDFPSSHLSVCSIPEVAEAFGETQLPMSGFCVLE